MSDSNSPELQGSHPPFRLSDYRDGFFQPNGQFSRDRLMSLDAIAVWEEQNHRIFQGKAWGAGQALFFGNRPLVFGRQTDFIDVKVDADPDQMGNAQVEMGVSRRHFELEPPTADGTVLIRDLGSTNGVEVFSSVGPHKARLNRVNPVTTLETGDFTLFGGGKEDPSPSLHKSRLIGFRVCQDADGKVFLVKFNAHDMGDLLGLVGKTESDLTLVNKIPASEAETADYPGKREIEEAYNVLLKDMQALRSQYLQPKKDEGQLLLRYQQLFSDMFELANNIGNRFYKGDWTTVMGAIGVHAIGEAQKFLNTGDKQTAAPIADLASLAMDLATNKLIRFTKD